MDDNKINKRPSFLARTLMIEKEIQIPLLGYSLAMTAFGISIAAAVGPWLLELQSNTDPNTKQFVIFVVSLSLAILVFMIVLGLVVTNKIAGPIYRLKQHLKQVNSGENPGPLTVRTDDFVSRELIDEYNKLFESHSKNKKSLEG